MKQALVYSLKVWLTSVVLGSIISSLPDIHHSETVTEKLFQWLETGLFFMCIATPFSLCSWLLLFLFNFMFTKQRFEVTTAKIVLSLVGLVLALAPLLWLMGGKISNDVMANLPLVAYPACIVAAIWFYRLKPAYKESTAQV